MKHSDIVIHNDEKNVCGETWGNSFSKLFVKGQSPTKATEIIRLISTFESKPLWEKILDEQLLNHPCVSSTSQVLLLRHLFDAQLVSEFEHVHILSQSATSDSLKAHFTEVLVISSYFS